MTTTKNTKESERQATNEETTSPSNNPNYEVYKKWVSLIALTCIWWGASAWNSVEAKRAAKANPNCISTMSTASNLLGLVFFVVIKLRQSVSLKAMFQELWEIRTLSAAHAIGLYAAYRGLVQGRVALVQAVKATEPLIAMAMSVIFYQQYPGDVRIVISVFVVVLGTICVLVQDTSFTYPALMWTLASSFSTQGRNQVMKHRQKTKGTTTATPATTSSESTANGYNKLPPAETSNNTPPPQPQAKQSPAMVGLLMFISTSAAAFFMNLLQLVLQLTFMGGPRGLYGEDTPLPIQQVLLAGAYHFAYNLASFAVLSLVDMPATHSLANTAKRAFVIAIAAWKLREPITPKALVGFIFVVGGSGCYGYFSKMAKKKPATPNISRGSITSAHNSPDFKRLSRSMKGMTLLFLGLVVFFQTKSLSRQVGDFAAASMDSVPESLLFSQAGTLPDEEVEESEALPDLTTQETATATADQ